MKPYNPDEERLIFARHIESLKSLAEEPGWKLFIERMEQAEYATYQALLTATDPSVIARLSGMMFAYSQSKRWMQTELDNAKQVIQSLSR